MGFTNDDYEGGSGKFANFKEGKIVTNIDGEKKTFSTLEGQIVDLDVQDATYQGKDYRKVVLFLAHEDGVTQLSFPLNSGYGWSFFQLCGNIDPKHEVAISGGTKEIPNTNGKKYGSMFVKQAGTNLKHLMKKDSDGAKKIPAVKEIKDSKGKIVGKDYSARDEYMEKVLTAFYKRVQKIFPNGAAAFKTSKHIDADPASGVNEPIDDLPF